MKKIKSNSSIKKVCVIGAWHLGCVISACLAEMGNKVEVVDFDKKIITNLQGGIPPLFEPGLQELVKKNMKKGRLNFFHDFKTSLNSADFIFITFDTPVNDKDQSDLRPIFNACKKIAKHSTGKNPYVIVSSQVPVGTCKKLTEFISKQNPTINADVLYNPENLRLGKAIDTFIKPDRIIIGAKRKETAARLLSLYKKIKSPKFVMSLESAEMIKHALNSYLAVSVSFINEIANLCEASGANVRDVVPGLKSDKRIGEHAFLNPGLGFAGGTLARDLMVLQSIGKKNKVKTSIIQSTLEVNRNRTNDVLKKIKKIFPRLKGLKGGVLGLTYKPGTSTLRRSISIALAQELSKRGIMIKAYDPKVPKFTNGESYQKYIKLCKSPYEVAKHSQFLLIATEWPEFKDLNFSQINKLMTANGSRSKRPVLIDTKNMLDPLKIVKDGFEYIGTGTLLK